MGDVIGGFVKISAFFWNKKVAFWVNWKSTLKTLGFQGAQKDEKPRPLPGVDGFPNAGICGKIFRGDLAVKVAAAIGQLHPDQTGIPMGSRGLFPGRDMGPAGPQTAQYRFDFL